MSDSEEDGELQTRNRRPPEDDPTVCSKCGTYLGTVGAISGDDYCDACAREVGIKAPLRECMGCGLRAPEEEMKTIDISPEDEYYPEIRYLCRGCSGGEDGE